jgi:rhodanese-related sulfurtransferase
MKKNWVKLAASSLLLLSSLVLMAGCASSAPVVEQQQVTDLSAQEAYTLIQERMDDASFLILDVRTPAEYEEGHLAGAVNYNVRDEAFRENLEMLDRDDSYLVYCRTGGRSQVAVDTMVELEFQRVYHMTGGITEWSDQSLPVVK